MLEQSAQQVPVVLFLECRDDVNKYLDANVRLTELMPEFWPLMLRVSFEELPTWWMDLQYSRHAPRTIEAARMWIAAVRLMVVGPNFMESAQVILQRTFANARFVREADFTMSPGLMLKQTPAKEWEDETIIEDLSLGIRTYNCLRRAGIVTVGELCDKTTDDLKAIPSLGRPAIQEIVDALASGGRVLRPYADDDLSIEKVGLSVLVRDQLRRFGGVRTLGDLVGMTEGDLYAIPNIGEVRIAEIVEILNIHGRSLRRD